MQDIVMSMIGDENYLWFCSENDITQMDMATGDCKYFNALDGHANAWFTEAKAIRQADGIVLFGYTEGYCSFDPNAVRSTQSVPPLQIICCHTKGSKIDMRKPIEIDNGEDFGVEFAALEYIDADKISYKMEGLQNEWTEVFDQRKLIFSNLGHGKYTLHVRSTNREGIDVANEISLAYLYQFKEVVQ